MNDTPKPPPFPPKPRSSAAPPRRIRETSPKPPGRPQPTPPSASRSKSPPPASGSTSRVRMVRKPSPSDSAPTPEQVRERRKARTSSPPPGTRPSPPSASEPKSPPPIPEPRTASGPTSQVRVVRKPPPPPPPPPVPDLAPTSDQFRERHKTSTPSASTSSPMPSGKESKFTRYRNPHLTSSKRWIPPKDITVSNFKAIKKAKIPLGENVTILVGPNSCGKSSILQAIHWATRTASKIRPGKQSRTLLFDDIDYMPSSDPVGTFHKGRLGTKPRSNSIAVSFRHGRNNRENKTAKVSIRTITGDSGIRVKITGGATVSPYKQKFQLISAYIPGVTGILEKEKRTVYFDILRKAASGQAGEVLRNILLNLKEDNSMSGENVNRLNYLNNYVKEIYPDIDIDVNFDESTDLYISATIGIDSKRRRPLDTASSGVLQVIHIFAYMMYFRPKVTLIEEPDSHIHPDKQDRLTKVLERAAKELDTQVIITTHSHHIVRGVCADSKIVWIKNGKPHVDEGDTVRRLLGWGGLDKSVFFFVEDEDHRAVTNILKQWPEIYQKVCICPCYGVGNLPRSGLLKGLLGENKLDIKVVVHRDRDFMTDDEVEIWKKKFRGDSESYKNVSTWVTSNSDVEAYFCDPSYLSKLYGVDVTEASCWLKEVMNGFYTTETRKSYFRKRKQTIMSLGKEYDEERSRRLWNENGPTLNTITGKDVYSAIKTYLQRKRENIENLNSFTIPDNFIIAIELRDIIRKAIG